MSTSTPLPASPLLRETLAAMDAQITASRDANEKMELRQLRIDTILSELPEHIIDQYEAALTDIDTLTALQDAARSTQDNPAYEYRELAAFARRWPSADITHKPLRAAVRARYGQELDEIAEMLGMTEDALMVQAANVARLNHEARDSDSKLARIRAFARSVESGTIIGITPQQHRKPQTRAVASNEPVAITTLAAAKRAGRATKAGRTSRKATRHAQKPAMTSQGSVTRIDPLLFRLTRPELQVIGTAAALAEIARRDAKRAAKKAVA